MTSSIAAIMTTLPAPATALEPSALSALAPAEDAPASTPAPTFADWLALGSADDARPAPASPVTLDSPPALDLTLPEQDPDTAPDSPWPPDGLASLWLPVTSDPIIPLPSLPGGSAMADTTTLATPALPDTSDLPASVLAATDADIKATLPTPGLPHTDSPPSLAASTTPQASESPGQDDSNTAFLSQPIPQAQPALESGSPPADSEPLPFSIQAALHPAEELPAEETGIKPIPSPAIAFSPPPLSTTAPISAPASSAPFPPPELHTDTFPDTLGNHIHWLTEQKIGHAHLQLHPQELGQLEVRLKLDGDQLHADFTSAQPEVRQALEHALPRLRDLLGEHGLHLAQADVGQQHAGQHAPTPSPSHASTDDTTVSPGPVTPSVSRAVHLLDAYA